ncbi:MAG: hypothetical protein ABIG60_05570 [Patescibacteria group bacterium]
MTQTKKEIIINQQNENKKNRGKIFKLRNFASIKLLNIIMLIFIVIAGVFYLVTMNDLIVKGFKLQEFKNEITILKNENKDLELKVMALESLNNLHEKAAKLNMVAVGEVDYLTVFREVAAR